MFVGHYGASFAGKALKTSIPLWVLFTAVQLLDVLWSLFVMMGIEKVRIVPGITKTNPLDLYYMPYTHSLLGAIAWSIGACAAYRFVRRSDGLKGAVIVGAAVFSHWVLDFVVHRPDLEMTGQAWKVGLGLWNRPLVVLAVELSLLFAGVYWYFRRTRALSKAGHYAMVAFGVMMTGIELLVFFGPPPPSPGTVAIEALGSYGLFAAVAYRLEKQRASL
jgi:hypothetical protein